MTREEIKDYLMHNFNSVYCDTCRHKMRDDECEECIRKMMFWSISEEEAKRVARKISGTNDTGYVGLDEDYLVSVKEVLNITAETGAMETARRVGELPRRTLTHGEWIEHKRAEEVDGLLVSNYECSNCHEWERKISTYCPHCGAMMKGVDNEKVL